MMRAEGQAGLGGDGPVGMVVFQSAGSDALLSNRHGSTRYPDQTLLSLHRGNGLKGSEMCGGLERSCPGMAPVGMQPRRR